MIDTNLIKNIKEVEEIKIKLLENLTFVFKGINDKDISLKEVLKDNIDLNKRLAEIMKIDIEK